MKKKHYYVCANGNRIEVPCPVAWEYADALTKRIKQIDMKNKKYKVEIPEGMKVKRELWPTTNSEQVVIEFEPIKKELPKTWDAYCELREVVIPYQFSIISKYGEEIQALAKLIELRDHYNDGWKPDWTTGDQKYAIHNNNNVLRPRHACENSEVLTFKSSELRDEFLKNFAELIETAKSLL